MEIPFHEKVENKFRRLLATPRPPLYLSHYQRDTYTRQRRQTCFLQR